LSNGNLDGGWAFSSVMSFILKIDPFLSTSTIGNTLVAFEISTTLKDFEIHTSTSSYCSISKTEVLINTSISLTKVSSFLEQDS
jgi:hypothetical protein